MRMLERIIGFVLILSIFTWITLSVWRAPLPSQSNVNPEVVLHYPIQTPAEPQEIVMNFNRYTYYLTPLFDYHIKGLVVSQHDTKSFTDISHSFDVINTKDLCLVWGENIANGSYRKVRFTSGDFTCYWSWNKPVDPPLVNSSVSNNHIIPATEEIGNSLKTVKRGDQVELTGKLVTYKVTDNESGKLLGERGTSTTREDTGSGACEVLYVTDLRIIKFNLPWWIPVKTLSRYSSVLSLVIWLFIISRPVRVFAPTNIPSENAPEKEPSIKLKL